MVLQVVREPRRFVFRGTLVGDQIRAIATGRALPWIGDGEAVHGHRFGVRGAVHFASRCLQRDDRIEVELRYAGRRLAIVQERVAHLAGHIKERPAAGR